MQYTDVRGEKRSLFTLGTVQLGMKYGLGEFSDKPPRALAFAMLDRAVALGVNTLDTANDYGDAQRLLGEWLSERRPDAASRPYIVTKIGPFDHASYDRLRDDVLRQAEACRKELGLQRLDCLMLHSYADYAQDPERIGRIFRELKEGGVCRHSAISAYSRHDYALIAASGFDAVQIPQNIFDWRQIDGGGWEALSRAGMEIYVRSVFLQGLIFQTSDALDPRMRFCAPYLDAFHGLCREFALAPDVLALSFVRSLPGVSSAVMGCDTLAQVEANCALVERLVELSPEQLRRLHETFRDTDPRVVDPGQWFNHT